MMEQTYFTDLDEVFTWVSQQLRRASVDVKSPFRWPVLCTAGPEPHGRVVVLRKFDPNTWRLTFYTDLRSQKVTDFHSQSAVECVFFDPRKMIQIRAHGHASVLTDGGDVKDIFASLKPDQKRDYGMVAGPGSPLSDGEATYDEPTARENFCLVNIQVQSIDFLNLSRQGHQRAEFKVGDLNGGKQWLTP